MFIYSKWESGSFSSKPEKPLAKGTNQSLELVFLWFPLPLSNFSVRI